MTPKEAFQKLKGYVPLDWEETKLVETALNRLEELEKANKSLTRELKKQDKELVGLTQTLRIIKEYILKDMDVFTNGSIAYIQFKCGFDSVCYGIPYEKLYQIKEYLK